MYQTFQVYHVLQQSAQVTNVAPQAAPQDSYFPITDICNSAILRHQCQLHYGSVLWQSKKSLQTSMQLHRLQHWGSLASQELLTYLIDFTMQKNANSSWKFNLLPTWILQWLHWVNSQRCFCLRYCICKVLFLHLSTYFHETGELACSQANWSLSFAPQF